MDRCQIMTAGAPWASESGTSGPTPCHLTRYVSHSIVRTGFTRKFRDWPHQESCFWLEDLLGFDIHSATRILPEFQNPQPGDKICMAPKVCMSTVFVVGPGKWFGWQVKDDADKPVWSFVFGLIPVDAAHTRLVVRESYDPAAMPAGVTTLIEIPDVVMEQKMLSTLQLRAEEQAQSPLVARYEIAVWLLALAVGVAAAVLYVGRRARRRPLGVAAAALLVLLGLTFLFPPLWVRGTLLVVVLAAGLIWAWRQPSKA